ncbi:tetratricopeptide repeat protein [Microbispora sp. H10836]|uniref:tetratricopeptide repeat protein n=1 Tax=Microbispora sp. H10836 TaxID=2729106 RepID=UPI001474A4B4|nr:tetratricopeptide repeat protein [Microbispora sp. H10836]
MLAGLDGADAPGVADALGLLASYSMISRSPDRLAVSVHLLVQTITLAGLPDEEQAELRRTAAGLLCAALPSNPGNISSWPAYARLLPHARAVLHPGSSGMRAVIEYLRASGDYRAATAFQQQRVSALHDTLGPHHPGTLIARTNLAYWMGKAGDAAGALGLFAALLPVRERVSGSEHPNTLTVRANLAHWTGEAGDPALARDLFAALLPIRERVSGPRHPNTVKTRTSLALWNERAERSM